jgi:hypothetical protein
MLARSIKIELHPQRSGIHFGAAHIGRTPAEVGPLLETSAAIWKRKRDWKCDMMRSYFLHF